MPKSTRLHAPSGSNPFEVSTYGPNVVNTTNSKFVHKLFYACGLLAVCSLFLLLGQATDLSPKKDRTLFRLNLLTEVLETYKSDLKTANGFVSLDVLLTQAVLDGRMSPGESEILKYDGWGSEISLTMKASPNGGLRFRLQSSGSGRDPITKIVVFAD